MIRAKLLNHAISPTVSISPSVLKKSGHCYVCGNNETWQKSKVINDALAGSWSINSHLRTAFDARESMFCPKCNCSFRLRQLAECLNFFYGGRSLLELREDRVFSGLEIAEINSCGNLHNILFTLPKLHYSEYRSDNKYIRSEDLQALTYKDESFDLILTSDTLEHIPNIKKVLRETRRVLKPGGKHIFTIPVIWSRVTRNRNDLNPSYHGSGQPDYLVFNEFGHDIINIIEASGFKVQVYKCNVLNLSDVAGVIIATRTGGEQTK